MENTEVNEPVIPIAQPAPEAPQAEGANAIMERFKAMKAAETAAPPSPENPKPDPAKPDPEPAPNTPEPEQQPKEKLKWGELKAKATRADELEAKLPTLEKELADLREKAAKFEQVDPTRYEAQIKEKEAKLAEYEKKIALQDVRESDQFRQEVVEPLKVIGRKIDRIALTYGADANALKDALTITDPKTQRERLTEIMAEFDPADQAAVRTLVNESLDLYEKADHLQANALEVKKEIEFHRHQETEKQKQARQKELQVAAEIVQKQYLEKLPFLFEDEATKQKVFAADMSLSDNPQWKAYRAYAGEVVPVLSAKLQSAQARVAELEGELAKRAAVGVKVNGGTATPPASEPPAGQYEGNSVWERAKAAAAQGHITLAQRRL